MSNILPLIGKSHKSVLGQSFVASSGPPPWNPSQIANLYNWYPVTLSNCFQDAAGTEVCTSAGQSVARVNDGRGASYGYLVQSNTGNQPSLEQDANGHWYLEFNGTSDFMTGPFPSTTTFEALPIMSNRSGDTGIDFTVYASGGNCWIGRYNASGTGYNASSAYICAATFPFNQVSVIDFRTGNILGGWNESVQVGNTTTESYITTEANAVAAAAATTFILGAYSGAYYAALNLYGFVLMGSTLISSSDKTALLNWANTNCGAI